MPVPQAIVRMLSIFVRSELSWKYTVHRALKWSQESRLVWRKKSKEADHLAVQACILCSHSKLEMPLYIEICNVLDIFMQRRTMESS